MPKLTRTKAVLLMESLGFPSASALSTKRLAKKINRLDRVTNDDTALETDNLNDLLDYVLNSIAAGQKVEVEEDRSDIPTTQIPSDGNPRKRKPLANFDERPAKYNWDEMFNGEIRVLQQGDDFTCKTASFVQQVKNAATKLQIKIQIQKDGNKVVVQASK